jgi:hypothetical protein
VHEAGTRLRELRPIFHGGTIGRVDLVLSVPCGEVDEPDQEAPEMYQ